MRKMEIWAGGTDRSSSSCSACSERIQNVRLLAAIDSSFPPLIPLAHSPRSFPPLISPAHFLRSRCMRKNFLGSSEICISHQDASSIVVTFLIIFCLQVFSIRGRTTDSVKNGSVDVGRKRRRRKAEKAFGCQLSKQLATWKAVQTHTHADQTYSDQVVGGLSLAKDQSVFVCVDRFIFAVLQRTSLKTRPDKKRQREKEWTHTLTSHADHTNGNKKLFHSCLIAFFDTPEKTTIDQQWPFCNPELTSFFNNLISLLGPFESINLFLPYLSIDWKLLRIVSWR